MKMQHKSAKSTLCVFVFTIAFLTLASPLSGKENLPAMVFGLNNDTLLGEIKVKNAFDRGNHQAYSYLQFSIVFTPKDGQTQSLKPTQIKGFLIWTSDSSFEKYVSARLDSGTGLAEEESKFGRPGFAARLGEVENEAFVRVLSEQGNAKLYAFYEEDVLTYSNGGIPPTYYNSLNERFLVRKGNGKFIKLNSKSKRRKAQLLEAFGDCAKIKTVLEKPKLDTGASQILVAIIERYNSGCGE